MGLDISHCKATLERRKTTDPNLIGGITRSGYAHFNVPFENFKRYIQEIDCASILNKVIIVRDESQLTEVKDWFKNSDYSYFFKESDEELNKHLIEYEIKNGFQNLNKHFSDQDKWIDLSYYEILKNEGFYFTEVGEQRKGMNEKFWERFYSNEVYDFAKGRF